MHALEKQTSQTVPVTSATVGGISESEGPTVMLTAQAFILNGARRIPVRLFLDHGSGLTFMSPGVRRLLMNVRPLSSRKLIIDTFSAQDEFQANRFRVVLQSTHDNRTKIPIFAYERDYPVNPQNPLSSTSREAVRKFVQDPQLADRSLLTGETSEPPGIIIGLDQMYRILNFEAPKAVGGELVALNSHLGWTVGGPLSHSQTESQGRVAAVNAVCCVASLFQVSKTPLPISTADTRSRPAELMEKLWRLETIGISDRASSSKSSMDEESALRQFEEGVSYDGKRYSVVFPKRDSIELLRNNYNVALTSSKQSAEIVADFRQIPKVP